VCACINVRVCVCHPSLGNRVRHVLHHLTLGKLVGHACLPPLFGEAFWASTSTHSPSKRECLDALPTLQCHSVCKHAHAHAHTHSVLPIMSAQMHSPHSNVIQSAHMRTHTHTHTHNPTNRERMKHDVQTSSKRTSGLKMNTFALPGEPGPVPGFELPDPRYGRFFVFDYEWRKYRCTLCNQSVPSLGKRAGQFCLPS